MNEQLKTYDQSLNSSEFELFDEFENDVLKVNEESPYVQTDLLQLKTGKHVQSFSVKVLDWDDRVVKTEFLINKEEGKYQTRMIPIEVFKNKDYLKHGYFLKAFLFVGDNEMSFKFVDGSDLVSEDDFPKRDLLKNLDSKLFKFK